MRAERVVRRSERCEPSASLSSGIRLNMRLSNQLLLPRPSMFAWIAAFFTPTVFFGLAEIGELFGLSLGERSGWLVYWVPCCSLLACWVIVLISRASPLLKTGWIALSLLVMVLQFVILVVVFGLIDFAQHGMEGIH